MAFVSFIILGHSKEEIMKKGLATVLLVSMIAASLAACGSSGSSTSSTGASTDTVAAGETTAAASQDAVATPVSGDAGNTVRVAAVDPQVALDPQQYTYSIIMKVTDNVCESLLTTLDDGSMEPTLLSKMPEISEDGLTYSFELLPDVKFHNGETLKASDVKYSLERLVKKTTMASLMKYVEGYDAMESGSASELSGIEVQDDTHFTIKLTSPYSPFESVLSTAYCAIYPQEACEAAGDNWGFTTLIGTGPFKLDSYTTGVGVELSKFDNYHGDPAKIDGISYKFIEDPNTQVLEFQKGNVDYVELDTALYPVYANDPTISKEMHSLQPIGGYSMSFNVKTIPDVKVREAISLAVDRQAICDSILHGTATVPNGYLPKGLIGYNPDAEPFQYDPAKAKELLTEAGYADGYNLRVTVNTKYATNVAIATAFQAQAKDAGINVEVEQVDSAAWSDMKANGGVDCGIGNWYVDYNDTDSMFYPYQDSRTDGRSSFWHNDEYKKLLEDGVKTTDEAERQKIYQRADEIMTREDFAVTPLYNETKYYILNPRVSGFEMGPTYRMFWKNAEITG